MPKPKLSRLKALAVSLASIVVLVTMTACQQSVAARPKPELTVMTYNVYVGASPDELLMVTNQAEIPGKVAEFHRNYQASDFPARAAAIAKIIKKSKPHVIGLQEISVIRTQTPADSVANPGAEPNATDVEIDFLEVVEAALKKEGLDYKVAGKVETFDLEMPGLTSTGLVDIRLTDHDAILVRGDVAVSPSQEAKYTTELPVGNLGLSVPRGYVAVNVNVGGVIYLVVNTHLEHFSPQVRLGQTRELLARLSNESRVILLGDFNTKATDGAAYQAITEAGFTDVWQGKDAGDTCCQADDLKNATSQLGDPPDGGRIDLIFTKGVTTRESASVSTYTVGDKPEDRTPAGLWPSDHAGVVAHLPLPEQKE